MKMYHVEYDNGRDYEDHWTMFIGVYTTEELAHEAGKIYCANERDYAPRCSYDVIDVVVDDMPKLRTD